MESRVVEDGGSSLLKTSACSHNSSSSGFGERIPVDQDGGVKFIVRIVLRNRAFEIKKKKTEKNGNAHACVTMC